MKIYKKFLSFLDLILNEGLIAVFQKTQGLFKKNAYKNPVQKERQKILNKIIKISNKKILHGFYKGTILSCKSNWGSLDFSAKLLGVYENQVQAKIIEIKNKYQINSIFNFGAAEGYHLCGLIKNKYFHFGYAFEPNQEETLNLKENLKLNNLENKVKIFNSEGNFQICKDIIDSEKIKKTFFLIDIEGDEFSLFNNENIEFLKNHFFLIEDHSTLYYDKNIKEKYYKIIQENFIIEIIHNDSRNPHKFEELSNFNDDEKWLSVSESRPNTMSWMLLKPF